VTERHLCIARRPLSQQDVYRPSVDDTLLPAVIDQILVDNREFFIHQLHSTLPLILIVLSTLGRGISDGDVAILEKWGDGFARSFNCPSRVTRVYLADALVVFNVAGLDKLNTYLSIIN